jgi:hypothetical protein
MQHLSVLFNKLVACVLYSRKPYTLICCALILPYNSYHGLPSWINTVTALKYRACTNNDTASFITRVHPLPLTAKQSIEIQTILSLFACLFIIIPLCYAPASFVVYAVKERCVGSKHLQLVSGNIHSKSYMHHILIY